MKSEQKKKKTDQTHFDRMSLAVKKRMSGGERNSARTTEIGFGSNLDDNIHVPQQDNYSLLGKITGKKNLR